MAAAKENHFAYGRTNESPFMYVATLSTKWVETKDQVASMEGKIKGFGHDSFTDDYKVVAGIKILGNHCHMSVR
nr:RecQ-mediated genome instability protein 1 [Tanacetum cinerariifolium]